MMDTSTDEYFTSYDNLEVHRIMLSDKRRVLAYKNAIIGNRDKFEGKVVLDVGAGTGILSIFAAQAGASKVYAVEAAPQMADLIRETAEENFCDGVVKVLEGAIEDVELPEKVDILISEWMGFYLFHEGMINSYIYARRFLKDDGIMIPDKCTLSVALCRLESYFEFWDDVHGVKMISVKQKYRQRYACRPEIMEVPNGSVVSTPAEFIKLDLRSVAEGSLDYHKEDILLVANSTGPCHGLCLWFDVELMGVPFSTGPHASPTHWKQTVIFFPQELILEENQPSAFEVSISRQQNSRRYDLQIAPLDESDVSHPEGCPCYNTKCILISAFIKSSELHPSED